MCTRVTVASLLVALAVLPVQAQTVTLPPTCLWVEAGKVQSQGDLKLPSEVPDATNVATLRALGNGLVLWTVEPRDDRGNLVQFNLSIANVKTGDNHRFFKDLDPFGLGTDWSLQRAMLLPSGRAVLLRVRLPGTGGHTTVYKLMLEPPYYWYEMSDPPPVWASFSADGAVMAMPFWELTADFNQASTEREARAATIRVAGKNTPDGRNLWRIPSFRAIPDWARPDITATAVSPNGRQVAYTNPTGLWLADISGGPPRLLAPEGLGPTYMYEAPVWAPDGSLLHFTRTEWSNNAVRGTDLCAVDPAQAGPVSVVRHNAARLCIPRL